MPRNKTKQSDDNYEAIKRELSSEILAAKIDLKGSLLSLENRLELDLASKLSALKNEILTNFDKSFGKLEKLREDSIFTQGKDREQDKRLDDLDNRVRVLETSHA
jgi:hypothetical protein